MTGNADTPQGAAAFASAADSLDTLAEAIAGLRSTLNTDEHLDSMLQRLAETAVKALPDADAVSVTVLSADGPRTAASTADYLSEIDDAQHSADRGPCVDAARTVSSVRAKVGDHEDTWPEFTAEARKQGVRSYLSVPITMGEGSTELLGAFNVYGFASTEFKPFDEELMKLFTAGAGAAIADSRRWRQAHEHIEQLHCAMESRAEIEQAKGVLIAVHGIDADEAFSRLVQQSQHTNVKLHEVARMLVDSVRHRRF
ncbi:MULTISPECIES: GAF and ANTAR domain-containing protein [Rhodococcus]|jgi:GAF domain-containing protein|uniref:GAF and ANTAR domain-containing protein n=1 Tax=Rhodococcus TaxID=1827 RepID=UPI000F5B5328|nr:MULTISPECIES: GAF and ANTAR domain-containing protein [Rhodococcus]NHP16641.1 GAF and ANTAR domain-containing protein [Rhodococcus sp. IC4_135]MBJ7480133.1 GAF and ANTAR domain-containing protein [Rhodococcus sp. (in: high G+C Gram-positive bacteria)]MDI9957844.1 GAF and ANTAR domain-containing protein [Rhodococcus sp. IEGM 1237]MDI9963299.1 GAF and ANTAR domain-containing protein [Rhodococcus sp. IEGM 1251]MDV8124804.1 GAF and ANTAR domain-containing protein [Rhodococcus sp. IEGM 1304]